MRVIQYRILDNILNQVPIPGYIHGFETGKSIPKMAEYHVGQQVVISIDIKDYFPSITQIMVEEAFNSIGIDSDSARILSELCTYKAFVPQGALTSPKVSNLITAGSFGPVVNKFCGERGLALTIYADDLTISFTKEFESREAQQAFVQEVIQAVTVALNTFGFRVNSKKTKVMRAHRRQWVCGAVVNAKVNMRRQERLNLKALVHNCEVNGLEAEAAKTGMNLLKFIRKYAGRLNWLTQLNPEVGEDLRQRFALMVKPLLRRHPDIEIPELAWSSSRESFPEEEPLEVLDAGTATTLSTETLS